MLFNSILSILTFNLNSAHWVLVIVDHPGKSVDNKMLVNDKQKQKGIQDEDSESDEDFSEGDEDAIT